MAGALRIPDDPATKLPLLLDILYTPWELPVDARVFEAVCAIVGSAYGTVWAGRVRRAAEIGNYHISKVQSPDVDDLRMQLAAVRMRSQGWARRLFRARNA